MFLVCDEFGIFTVYGVRENVNGIIEFLLYSCEGWTWEDSRHFKPYQIGQDEEYETIDNKNNNVE